MAYQIKRSDGSVTQSPDWKPVEDRPQQQQTSNLHQQYADKYGKPPAGFVPRDPAQEFQQFEQNLIDKIGGNPFEFDTFAEVERAFAEKAPELFEQVFPDLIWEDRNNMSPEQQKYWQAAVQSIRRQIKDVAEAHKKHLMDMYTYGMTKFKSMQAMRAKEQERLAKYKEAQVAGTKTAKDITKPTKIGERYWTYGKNGWTDIGVASDPNAVPKRVKFAMENIQKRSQAKRKMDPGLMLALQQNPKLLDNPEVAAIMGIGQSMSAEEKAIHQADLKVVMDYYGIKLPGKGGKGGSKGEVGKEGMPNFSPEKMQEMAKDPWGKSAVTAYTDLISGATKEQQKEMYKALTESGATPEVLEEVRRGVEQKSGKQQQTAGGATHPTAASTKKARKVATSQPSKKKPLPAGWIWDHKANVAIRRTDVGRKHNTPFPGTEQGKFEKRGGRYVPTSDSPLGHQYVWDSKNGRYILEEVKQEQDFWSKGKVPKAKPSKEDIKKWYEKAKRDRKSLKELDQRIKALGDKEMSKYYKRLKQNDWRRMDRPLEWGKGQYRQLKSKPRPIEG